MTIINGTFNTDLNGWEHNPDRYTGQGAIREKTYWDNGKAHLINGYTGACEGIYPWLRQNFLIMDTTISFDYIASRTWPGCFGNPPPGPVTFKWSLIAHIPIIDPITGETIITDVTIYDEELSESGGTTITRNVSNQYIGKNATIMFSYVTGAIPGCGCATADMWIDNVINSPNWGTLRVSSVPGGANIYIDNYFINFTPETGSIDLTNISPEHHTIKITKTDYYDSTATVDVYPGRIYEISATLYPHVGCLSILSDPVGAEIFLSDRNGQVLNDTGLTTFTQICDLFFGDYKWKLIKPGYMPESGTASITDVSGAIINKTLTLIDVGCIYFETDPPGARIILDGNDTEKVTPDVICNLILGQHCYRLILPGYIEISDCVTLVSTHGEAISATLSSCPTVTLSANIISASIGDIIVLTANVQPTTQQYPVTFKINETQVGTCNTSDGVCSVNWDTTELSAGSYIITAEVGPLGYQTLQQSCTSIPITVTLVEPCVLITISSNKPSAFIGDIIIFTTNTQPSTQTYIVELRDQNNNLIGNCTTSGGTCPINWDTTGLVPGSYTMTAKVQGQVQCISTPITITLSEVVQAGFGGVGMILIAGLIVGAIYMTTRK